jgi:ribosomal protein S18 acetylase RimI-like enzyme
MPEGATAVTEIGVEALEARVAAFGSVLHACVHAGASVSFVLPFTQADAEAFWRQGVLPALRGGQRALFAAEVGGRLAGTVQLDWDTPPNQPHRAEVRKLLVHPDFRRRGLGRLLMAAVEARARAVGRSLLTLDTRTGDAAEPLYVGMGYTVVGTIPAYARHPVSGAEEACTILWKRLAT